MFIMGTPCRRPSYDRVDVMTISMHESGRTLFPGTGFPDEIGTGAGEGYSVNIPLPSGTYDDIWLAAFHETALPLMGAYDPDVIVIEIGMDTLSGDPLAHLSLTNNAPCRCAGRRARHGQAHTRRRRRRLQCCQCRARLGACVERAVRRR